MGFKTYLGLTSTVGLVGGAMLGLGMEYFDVSQSSSFLEAMLEKGGQGTAVGLLYGLASFNYDNSKSPLLPITYSGDYFDEQ